MRAPHNLAAQGYNPGMQLKFSTIGLVGKYNSTDIAGALSKLAEFLTKRNVGVLIESETARSTGIQDYPVAQLPEIGERADLVIILAGDGTMLNIARNLVGHDARMVGVNQGRLGFLTDVPLVNMLPVIGEIIAGHYAVEERFLLSAHVWRENTCVFEACALNDVVVSKGNTGRLIEFEVSVDNQFVYSQRSDGIVIATPTGSTAYALSAGGPILHPSLEAIALVPICPHTLSNRPIAVNSHSQVEVALSEAIDARVHFDGQTHFDLLEKDRVTVTRGQKTIRLLHPLSHSYYDTLRQKLKWGEKL